MKAHGALFEFDFDMVRTPEAIGTNVSVRLEI